MKPKLSVLMPAKRTERWAGLYDSINNSFSGEWELLISTKMEIPENMKNIKNASFVFSERSPLHKQQELLTMAKGEYITAISDDTLFQPDAFDRTFEILEKNENHGKFAVCKYLEGKEIMFEPFYGPDAGPHLLYDMQPPQQGRNDNKHTWYYPPPSPVVTQICGYMEHGSGDHGALHEAALADAVIFKEMYEKPESIERRSINLMNWKNTPEVWARRANHVDNPI
jgi:hypothetical protein